MSNAQAKHVVSNALNAARRAALLRKGLPVAVDGDAWPPPAPITRALIANGDFLEQLEEEDRMRRFDDQMCAFAKRRRQSAITAAG